MEPSACGLLVDLIRFQTKQAFSGRLPPRNKLELTTRARAQYGLRTRTDDASAEEKSVASIGFYFVASNLQIPKQEFASQSLSSTLPLSSTLLISIKSYYRTIMSGTVGGIHWVEPHETTRTRHTRAQSSLRPPRSPALHRYAHPQRIITQQREGVASFAG